MKIIKANNFIDAEIGAIKEIVPNSLHEKYIVITPDRYSLNLEKNIFEILNVDSLFKCPLWVYLGLLKKFYLR